jgi:hypothetical protein
MNIESIKLKEEVPVAKIITGQFLPAVLAALILNSTAAAGEADFPKVLGIRERVDLVNTITLKRLDLLVPKFMRETGLDMWIITCNEDDLDPIFKTMIPYGNWCPITQIIVFFDRGPEKGLERLNVSRTGMPGFFERVWDSAAWDDEKKESQWVCLGRIVRERRPEVIEKYGKDDTVIRPGDFIHCDVGLKYMYYNSDHQEWAYVPRVGETDVPGTFKKLMAEGNRLQDVYGGEFKTGLTGNQLLANILRTAREKGISMPKIYSHSLGYFLHEPGPLIGLPWEQVNNPGRGDVKLVPNSCFTAEMSVTMPIPEWDGKEFRLSLEQDIVFTGEKTYFLDGRQIKFHIIN